MNGTGGISNAALDCTRLLKYSSNAESDCASYWNNNINLYNNQKKSNSFNSNDEASASSSSVIFGHPDPPQLHLFRIPLCWNNDNVITTTAVKNNNKNGQNNNNNYLDSICCMILIAHTKHTVSAQVFQVADEYANISSSNNNHNHHNYYKHNSDPIEVCMLLPEKEDYEDSNNNNKDFQDEQITCLTLVSLIDNQDTDDDQNSTTSSAAQQQQPSTLRPSTSFASITSSSSLMKGVVKDDEEQNSNNNYNETITTATTTTTAMMMTTDNNTVTDVELAVVFGTNCSRIYTVEFELSIYTDRAPTLTKVHVQDAITSQSSLFQVFPKDSIIDDYHNINIRKSKNSNNNNTQKVPFHPKRGVDRIVKAQHSYLWIVYGDGTLLKVHAATLFPSIWQQASSNGLSVETYIRRQIQNDESNCALVRCKVIIPPEQSQRVLILPLPRHHPSPMSPLTDFLMPNNDNKTAVALSRSLKSNEIYDAIVFGQSADHMFPAIAFFSSEHDRTKTANTTNADELSHTGNPQNGRGRSDSASLGSSRSNSRSAGVRSVTKSLVGSALGAIRWGLGAAAAATRPDDAVGPRDSNMQIDDGYRETQNNRSIDGSETYSADFKTSDDGDDYEDDDERNVDEVASSPFPSLWDEPIGLYVGTELHDAPRKVEYCSIDPDGKLAAAADGLGRILLIDLTSKQVIRMWKGFREASCYWLQTIPRDEYNNGSNSMDISTSSRRGYRRRVKPLLYLVIHSRQRRVVEVWRVRHGHRVLALSVSRDARIIPYTVAISTDDDDNATHDQHLAGCYLVHSTVAGTQLNKMEPIRVDESPSETTTMDTSISRNSTTSSILTSPTRTSTPSRKAAQRLQHLQQLLSAGNIQFTKEDVKKALFDIKSLADLATALDLLAVGTVLEKQLEVKGSTFQHEALSYCLDVLNSTTKGKDRIDNAASNSRVNPHINVLVHKIGYHTQIVKAYDVLYKFESSEIVSSQQQAKTPSHWAAEAMAWASTYEQVTGTSLDAGVGKKKKKRMLFAQFASSCTFPDILDRKKNRVYFSESSRTRRYVLEHVFKPLLADVFSFNVVYSIFDLLGTRADSKYIEKCFGEWFMTLYVREAYSKGLFSESPPMIRLLQDLVAQQLTEGPGEDDVAPLHVLYKFCEESSDLVRAFMLGTICLEAVSKVATQKEKKTYGKVQGAKMVNDWKVLLRKLRVCLLVSLRMHGTRIAAPISVSNVNQDDLFSVYEWLATDELSMSHNHDEIVSLEKACMMSSYAFDPSTPDGDGPSRFKMLQNSCLSAAISEEERSEYLVDFNDEDRFGALLLFLSSYNDPKLLAAHRALLLAAQWGTKPEDLHLLRDCVVTLKSLQRTAGYTTLTAAICYEIWQSRLSPIYRAHLFGFDDVQQLSEEVVFPLLQNRDWFVTVGRVGLQLLAILKENKFDPETAVTMFNSFEEGRSNLNSWPPLRPDCALKRIVNKITQEIDESALHAHSVVVCALLVSGDIKTLVKCVPTIYELFTSNSLFLPVANSSNVPELQRNYLQDAVLKYAAEYRGAILERFDLGEITTLSKTWSIELHEVHTLFLLAMYEIGKDCLVDELLTKASSQIDVRKFVIDGLDNIACRRLNFLLDGNRMQSPSVRDVVSLLDADLCEFIKQRATASTPLTEQPLLDVPIDSTHLFIMRLLSLSSASDVESALRIKIHSMVVLSGILAKALSGS